MQKTVSRIKVKVCGMTQVSQVAELVDLSIDAIGVILHANSPRLISVEQAIEIRKQIPAFISMVGVFVDCDVAQVNDYKDQIGLDLVQLHGAETADYVEKLSSPYIKAVRARSSEQVLYDINQHFSAKAVLLDPYVKGQHGGTGIQLDENAWPKSLATQKGAQKLILAGGLAADNLLAAVQKYQPFAVDLNSGVEAAPGLKDIDLVTKCLKILGR